MLLQETRFVSFCKIKKAIEKKNIPNRFLMSTDQLRKTNLQ